MFNINWKHTCYECGCPLYLTCTIKEDNLDLFFRDFTSWAYLKPFTLLFNRMYYKFYGYVVHKVCVSCYYFPRRVDLRKREIGQKNTQKPIYLSKTFEDIYDYFQRFQEFRKRRDLESFIVEEEKRQLVPGLDLCWSFDNLNIYI